jgi:hypothetical protein
LEDDVTKNYYNTNNFSEIKKWYNTLPKGTVEALVFKAEHFQTILDLPREYPPQWSYDGGMPINDHLTINVPKRD